MYRWAIGIVLLIGLSLPVIALATNDAQPTAIALATNDAQPTAIALATNDAQPPVPHARVGQPRLAFDERAKMIMFDDWYPIAQTLMLTDVVDITLDPFDLVWGGIDKHQQAAVWHRTGAGNRYYTQYSATEYCNDMFVRTLSLSRSQAGCVFLSNQVGWSINGLFTGYANPAFFFDLSTYPTIADYIIYHAIESEWGGEHGLVLTEDGMLWPVGYNSFRQANALATVLVGPWPRSFDAGETHSIAARADGSVMVWGGDVTGSGADTYCVRTIPTSVTNVIKVAAGAYHNLALRSDGTVVGWGGEGSSCVQGTFVYPAEAVVPYGLTNIVDIAAGNGVSAALNADGLVYVWGSRCAAPTLVQPLPPCTLASKLSGIVKIQVASMGPNQVHVIAIAASPVVRSVMRCVGSITPCTSDPTLPISGGRIMITGEYLRNTMVMLDNKTIQANMITYDSNNAMYVSLPGHLSGSANLTIIGSNMVPVNVAVRYSSAIATLTNTATATATRTNTRTQTATKVQPTVTPKIPTATVGAKSLNTMTVTRTITMTRSATRTATLTTTLTKTATRTATRITRP